MAKDKTKKKKATPKKKAAKKSRVKSTKPKGAKQKSHIRPGNNAVGVYLTLPDSKGAIDFYKKAFGAKEKGRLLMKNGAIGHAEITIEKNNIMLSDENPEWGHVSPRTLNGTPFSLTVYVKNADKFFARAIAAGATEVMPVTDQFYGDRMGVLLDPFGFKWSIATHKKNVSFKQMQKMMNEMKWFWGKYCLFSDIWVSMHRRKKGVIWSLCMSLFIDLAEKSEFSC